MDYTTFDISRKIHKDNFLQKFLLKTDSKETSNTEIITNLVLSKSLEENTPGPNYLNTSVKQSNILKPYLLNSIKENIEIKKDKNNTAINSNKMKKITNIAKFKIRSANQSNKEIIQEKDNKNQSVQYKKININNTSTNTVLSPKSNNKNTKVPKPPIPFIKRPFEKKENVDLNGESKKIEKKGKNDSQIPIENKTKKEVNTKLIEKLARPKKIDNPNESQRKSKLLHDRKDTKSKSVSDHNYRSSLAGNKKKASDSEPSVQPNNIKVNIPGLEINHFANNSDNFLSTNLNSLLPKFMNTESDKYYFSPKTLPTYETLAYTIESKKTLLTSSFEKTFEKGFIRNKYKDILETLKC